MSQAREAIKQDRYLPFVRNFFSTLYHGDKSQYPTWAIDALRTVGIDLLENDGVVEQGNGT
jgi:queuine tRNA-ribosyltransferase catalytic subunit